LQISFIFTPKILTTLVEEIRTIISFDKSSKYKASSVAADRLQTAFSSKATQGSRHNRFMTILLFQWPYKFFFY